MAFLQQILRDHRRSLHRMVIGIKGYQPRTNEVEIKPMWNFKQIPSIWSVLIYSLYSTKLSVAMNDILTIRLDALFKFVISPPQISLLPTNWLVFYLAGHLRTFCKPLIIFIKSFLRRLLKQIPEFNHFRLRPFEFLIVPEYGLVYGRPHLCSRRLPD